MQPLLCEKTLQQLADDIGSELLPELFNVFIEENSPQLASLKRDSDSWDLSQLQSLSHTLKSSAASYGGLRLAELATQLDLACKLSDKAAAQSLLPEFIDVYTQTLEVIKQRY